MARRTIIADDLTDVEIPEGLAYAVEITVSITRPETTAEDGTVTPGEVEKADAIWECAAITADSLYALVADSDLATLIANLRTYIKIAPADSEVIRKWVRETHPEMKVPERGRLGAEIVARYREEVIRRADTGDKK